MSYNTIIFNRLRTRDPTLNLQTDLVGANLEGIELPNLELEGANLTNAILSRAQIPNANLKNANLTGATLIGAELSHSDLQGTICRGANMSNAILINTFLQNTDLQTANLTGARFNGANISESNFNGANLSNANFANANIIISNLSNTNLNGTNFERATISFSLLVNINPDIFNTDVFDNARLDRNFENVNDYNRFVGTHNQFTQSRNFVNSIPNRRPNVRPREIENDDLIILPRRQRAEDHSPLNRPSRALPPPPFPDINFQPLPPPANVQVPSQIPLYRATREYVQQMHQDGRNIIFKCNQQPTLDLEVVDLYDLTYDDNGNIIEGLNNPINFLNHNPNNLVFLFQNKFYYSNKEYLTKTLNDEQFIKYGCHNNNGSLAPQNIIDRPCIMLKPLGILLDRGVITYLQGTVVELGTNRFFKVVPSGERYASSVSLAVLKNRLGSRVSGSHCQEGQDEVVYNLKYIDLPQGTGGKKMRTRKRMIIKRIRKTNKERKFRKQNRNKSRSKTRK